MVSFKLASSLGEGKARECLQFLTSVRRRGLRLPIRRGRFMDGANLGMMAFSILQGLLPKHSSTATSGSTTSSGGSGSNAHVK